GELLRERADAVGRRQRRELYRREHAERVPGRVHEATARVTRDAGRGRVQLLAPALRFFLVAEAHTRLRAERADAQPQDRVAVAEDLFALGRGSRGEPFRAAPEGHRRIHFRDLRSRDLDQGEVVVGARVRVFLAVFLHRDPRVVGERADQRAVLDAAVDEVA